VTVIKDDVTDETPVVAAVGVGAGADVGKAGEEAAEPGGRRVDVAGSEAGVLVQSQAEPAVGTPLKGAGSSPRVRVLTILLATPMMEDAAHTDKPGSVTLCSQAHVGRPVIS